METSVVTMVEENNINHHHLFVSPVLLDEKELQIFAHLSQLDPSEGEFPSSPFDKIQQDMMPYQGDEKEEMELIDNGTPRSDDGIASRFSSSYNSSVTTNSSLSNNHNDEREDHNISEEVEISIDHHHEDSAPQHMEEDQTSGLLRKETDEHYNELIDNNNLDKSNKSSTDNNNEKEITTPRNVSSPRRVIPNSPILLANVSVNTSVISLEGDDSSVEDTILPTINIDSTSPRIITTTVVSTTTTTTLKSFIPGYNPLRGSTMGIAIEEMYNHEESHFSDDEFQDISLGHDTPEKRVRGKRGFTSSSSDDGFEQFECGMWCFAQPISHLWYSLWPSNEETNNKETPITISGVPDISVSNNNNTPTISQKM